MSGSSNPYAMRIVIFKAFPDPYRQSMRVYADSLRAALKPLLAASELVTDFLPKGIRTTPRPVRWWSQYVRYQRCARWAQGDVNHVVDHAYGHLLYALDPVRTVVTVHDTVVWKAWSRDGAPPAVRWRVGPIQRYNLAALRRAAAIICVSEASRKEFLRLAPYPADQVAVIHEGVAESFSKGLPEDAQRGLRLPSGRYLLHVGHTREYKNIPALLQVLAILTQSLGCDVKLLKVGEVFTRAQEQLAKALGVRDRLVHLGIVPDEQLPAIYRCAELLLVPSWDEGFGLPVLEAMASGVPVVVSNRGALPEVAGDAGLIVDPRDHAAMAKAVAEVLKRPLLHAQLREAGLQRARQFTWEAMARRTLDVYRTVYQS